MNPAGRKVPCCGNAIAEYRDNIVILEHGANFRKYVIPKSMVERYDGTDIYRVYLAACSQRLTSEQSLLSNDLHSQFRLNYDMFDNMNWQATTILI